MTGALLRQPEVQHLHLAGLRQHDVLRLEVAMDDVDAMRGYQHLGHGGGDTQLLVVRQPAGERVVQGLAFDVFEDQHVDLAALDVVEDAADVRMIELGESARLAQQALARFAVQALIGMQRLERDLALQLLIEAGVDLPHPAGTYDVDDTDMAETTPDELHGGALQNCPNFELTPEIVAQETGAGTAVCGRAR
jgi:hypothetical protein